MTSTIRLFDLNPHVDRVMAAADFAKHGRVQIRNFLTPTSAANTHQVLSRETPWGLAWRAGSDGPHALRRSEVAAAPPHVAKGWIDKIGGAMRGKDYAFLYARYSMLTAYLEKWGEHPALDALLEHINDEPLLDLVRQVTGVKELVKADAQATLYSPNHFLSMHDDGHMADGWRIAYVMNFCAEEWRPDWGGYLMFYDEDGDVVGGFRPRFNALNMFRVPQRHNVTYVTPFAPVARYAITGWFRDR